MELEGDFPEKYVIERFFTRDWEWRGSDSIRKNVSGNGRRSCACC